MEIYLLSDTPFIKPNSLLENNNAQTALTAGGETYRKQSPEWHALQSRGGKTLAWLLAGSRVRIGLYFWKGVCVWIGRLVRSAKIFPTAATVRR